MAELDPKNGLLIIVERDNIPYFLVRNKILPETTEEPKQFLSQLNLIGTISKYLGSTEYNAIVGSGVRLHYNLTLYLAFCQYKEVDKYTWIRLDELFCLFKKQEELLKLVIKGYIYYCNFAHRA